MICLSSEPQLMESMHSPGSHCQHCVRKNIPRCLLTDQYFYPCHPRIAHLPRLVIPRRDPTLSCLNGRWCLDKSQNLNSPTSISSTTRRRDMGTCRGFQFSIAASTICPFPLSQFSWPQSVLGLTPNVLFIDNRPQGSYGFSRQWNQRSSKIMNCAPLPCLSTNRYTRDAVAVS